MPLRFAARFFFDALLPMARRLPATLPASFADATVSLRRHACCYVHATYMLIYAKMPDDMPIWRYARYFAGAHYAVMALRRWRFIAAER